MTLENNQNIDINNIGYLDLIQKTEKNINPIKLKEVANKKKCFIWNFFRKILNKREIISIPTKLNPIIIYFESINEDNKNE